MSRVSLRFILEAVAGLDTAGGASIGLAAWDLWVEEQDFADAWERAIADVLLKPGRHDDANGEQPWRLTAGGWAALQDDQPETL